MTLWIKEKPDNWLHTKNHKIMFLDNIILFCWYCYILLLLVLLLLLLVVVIVVIVVLLLPLLSCYCCYLFYYYTSNFKSLSISLRVNYVENLKMSYQYCNYFSCGCNKSLSQPQNRISVCDQTVVKTSTCTQVYSTYNWPGIHTRDWLLFINQSIANKLHPIQDGYIPLR